MGGLLGLAGVAGALAAPAVGGLSDRGYPRLASGCALLIGMFAFGLLWTVGGTITGLAIGERCRLGPYARISGELSRESLTSKTGWRSGVNSNSRRLN